jgi:pilus assembly protein CpaE
MTLDTARRPESDTMTKHMSDLLDISAPVVPAVAGIPLGPIPALSLAAFSATAQTHRTLAQLAECHQMARVRMSLSEGGLSAALRTFEAAPSPQVIVLEHSDGHDALLSGLDALAELCEAGTRVIVLGAENDIQLYRELMRRGVSEYLPAPVTVAQMLRCLADLTAQPGAVRQGHVHAFVGACGGAGSSTVALNMAWLIGQSRKSPVSLIDLDLDFGTAGLNLAIDGARGIAEVLTAGRRLDPQFLDGILHKVDDHLRVLPVSEDGDHPDPAPEVLDHLIDLAREGAAHVVLDLPAARSAVSRRALVNADHVVVTATPDLAGLRNAKKVVELVRRLRPGADDPLVVLNKTGIARRPEITARDFAAALGVELAATLPFDPRGMAAAVNSGKVYAGSGKGKAAAQALRPLVEALSGHAVKARPAGLRDRLAALLKRG